MSKNHLTKETQNTDGICINSISHDSIDCKTNEFNISTDKQGNIKVVEHFTGKQTYVDIIKSALRREFAE